MDKGVSASAGRRWRVIRAPVDHLLPKAIKVSLTMSTITGRAAGWRPKDGMRTVIVLTSLLAVQYCRSTPPFPGGGGGKGMSIKGDPSAREAVGSHLCADKHGPLGSNEPRRAVLFRGQPTAIGVRADEVIE
jgi:hypothetical protein